MKCKKRKSTIEKDLKKELEDKPGRYTLFREEWG